MDESTGNLNSRAEAEVLEAILNLHRQGKTIVIITHNHEIAKAVAEIERLVGGKYLTKLVK